LKTVVENLTDLATDLKNDLKILIEKFAKQHKSQYDSTYNQLFWEDLSRDGERQKDLVFKKYESFYQLVSTLLSSSEPQLIKRMGIDNIRIRRIIALKGTTYTSTKADVLKEAFDHMDSLVNSVNSCYSIEGETHFIPDTNALYCNQNLESWVFNDIKTFTIVLTPSVLSELDYHKENHNNPDVRKKSQSLIRQIKEFRRRGSLAEGITIVNGKIYIKSLAVEPDLTKSLPWLDNDCKDDRFLATVLEYMRDNTRLAVCIVTADINMQNKAELARLPYIEPPEKPKRKKTKGKEL